MTLTDDDKQVIRDVGDYIVSEFYWKQEGTISSLFEQLIKPYRIRHRSKRIGALRRSNKWYYSKIMYEVQQLRDDVVIAKYWILLHFNKEGGIGGGDRPDVLHIFAPGITGTKKDKTLDNTYYLTWDFSEGYSYSFDHPNIHTKPEMLEAMMV